MQRDPSKALRYAALQSHAGKKLLQRCGRAPDDISSIVFVEPDACYIKSEAVLRIAQKLDQPFPALASSLLPLPGIIRDAVYDQVRHSLRTGPQVSQRMKHLHCNGVAVRAWTGFSLASL